MASCTAPSALSRGAIEVCALTTHSSQAESAPFTSRQGRAPAAGGANVEVVSCDCRACFRGGAAAGFCRKAVEAVLQRSLSRALRYRSQQECLRGELSPKMRARARAGEVAV